MNKSDHNKSFYKKKIMRVTETSKTLSTSDSKTLDDRFQKKKNEVVTPITTKTFYEPRIEVEQNFQKS